MRALKGNFSILQLFALAGGVAGGCVALTQADRLNAPILLAHSVLVVPRINLKTLSNFFIGLHNRWVSFSILIGIVLGVVLAFLSRWGETWRFLTIDFDGLVSGARIGVFPIVLTEFVNGFSRKARGLDTGGIQLQTLEFNWSRFWWARVALIVVVPPLAVSWFWGLSYFAVRFLTPF